jgi:hypothetical protein
MKKQLLIKVSALVAIYITLTAFMLPFYQGKKDFPTEKFSKVSIGVKSKVYIEQGDAYKLDIQADEKTLENISVEFKSDELQIERKRGWKIDEPVTIYITAPSLNGISLAGSSELFVEKTFVTGEMDLSLAGSGKMRLNDLKADKVSVSIAGSGDILLAGGQGKSVEEFSIAGSGNLDALEFEAAEVSVDIAGSGDCKVFASEKLNISIAGSGSVYYKGKPVVKTEIAGSGKVKQIGVENE